MFNDAVVERINKIAQRYPDRRAALIPALHVVQAEIGHLNQDAVRFVAGELNVPVSEVYGTASFYSLFRWKPSGRHVIYVCHNLSCSLMGAESLIEHLGKKLGVHEGEPTPDGKFSFERIECIGRCDLAPSMMVGKDYYDNLTPEKIDEILKKYE